MNPSCSFMGISRISKENQCIFHENIQLKKVSEIEILGGRRFLASWHDDRGRFRSDLSRSETSMDIFVSHLTSDLTLDITSDPLHFFTDISVPEVERADPRNWAALAFSSHTTELHNVTDMCKNIKKLG